IVVSGQLARAPVGPPRLALDVRGALDPRLIEPFARAVVRNVDGKVGVSARVEGPVTAPAVRARLELGGTSFTLVEGGQRFQIPRGALTLTMNASDRLAELRNVEVRVGSEVRATVGPQTEPPRVGLDGRLRFAADDLFRLIAVDVPARGTVHA